MRKALSYLFGLMVLTMWQPKLHAQCNPGENEYVIEVTTLGATSYPSELRWAILDGTNTQIDTSNNPSYSTNTVYTSTICLTDGASYTFRAYDTYGDGWNGCTYRIYRSCDNSVVADNGGATPDNGSGGSNDLEVSEAFNALSTACPSCTFPSGLGASNIMATSADLNWTAGGSETQWDIEYGAQGFTQGAGTTVSGITSNPYTLTGLSSSTDYDFYVRADCGANGTSPWAGPFSFKTAFQCPTGAVCGTYTSGDIDTDRSFTSLGGSSTCAGSMVLNIPVGDWIDSVDVYYDMSTASNGWMSEQRSWLNCPTTGNGEAAIYSGTGNGGTMSYNRNSLNIANTAIGAVTFELHAGRTFGGSGCNATYNLVDNGTWIVVAYHSLAPACTPPNSLTASNITSSTADLGWTSTGTETQWDIEYGAQGFTQGAGTTVTGVTSNPYNLTGLSANTAYDFYVRADCGGSTSNWTGPYSFSTPCVTPNPATLPFVEDFESINGSSQTDVAITCNTSVNIQYTNDNQGLGRARWGTNAITAISGSGAVTLDMNPSGTFVTNYLEFTVNLSSYTANTDLELLFDYQDHGDEDQAQDSVWIRGSSSDSWVGIYDLNPTALTNGTTANVGPIDIDAALTAAGQTVSSTFQIRFGQNDNFPATSTTGSDGFTFDNITVRQTPSCLKPDNQSASGPTASSSNLSWTENGTATTWIIEYGLSGFSQGSGTTVVVNSNPYTLTGLSADTEYDYYVRAFCTVGDSSFWEGPYTFRTACNPFTAPYSQNFDGETAPAVNSCWTVINTVNLARLQTDATPLGTSANSAPNAVEFYNYTGTNPSDQILVSPMFSDFDNTKRIKFYLYDYSNTSDMIIGTMSDPSNAATFTPFDTITEADMDDDTWEEFIVSFASYTGTDKYVAFAHGMNTTFDYIHLDDFVYEDIPSCPDPTLLMGSNITSSSVDLDWTENAGATAWQVSYGASGTTATAGTKVLAGTKPYTLSGLMDNSTYDIYLRSICAPGDTSPWTGPVSITTLCNAFVAPWSENFDNGGSIPSCWNQGSGNSENWNFGTSAQYGPTSDNTSGSGYFAWIDDSSPHNTSTILESPSIDLTALTVPMLRFYLWSENHGNTTTFLLHVDVDNGSGWVLDSTLDIENTSWELQSLDFSAYAAQTIRIRFRGEEVGTGYQKDIAIDDVSIIEAPNCPEPFSLMANNITATTADLSWTAGGTETAWDIEIGLKGFTPTGTPTTAGVTNPYNATGLSGATAYEYYVRAACGGTDGNSTWAGPFEFTTALPSPRTINCTSGFASAVLSQEWDAQSGWTATPSFGSGSTARRWNINSGGTTSGSTGPNGAHSGSNYVYFETSSGSGTVGTLVSPAIDLTGSVNFAELSFWLHAYGATTGTLEVGVATSSTGPFTNLLSSNGQIQTSNAEAWTNVGVNLDAYVGQTIYLEFKYTMGSSFTGDLALDLIEVNTCVSCPAPSAFTTDTVQITEATLSWTENGTSTTWLVEHGPSGFTPGSGTEVSTGSNPYTITGLTENTAYDVYLRSFCAVGDTSTRVGPLSFTTLCALINTFPYTQNFDGLTPNNGSVVCATTDNLGDCWSNEGNSDDKDWIPRSVGTGSSNTGPSSDNTGGGNYLFIETSGCYNQNADLYSPVFDFTTNTAPRIRYYYHMYGAAMGSLELAYSTDSGATWSAPIASVSGDQGNNWNQDGALILSLAGENAVIFRFRATSGTSLTSDLAIDDIIVDQAPQDEVGVTNIAIAGDGCGTNQVVTATIGNFGAATQTSIPVSYEVNGNTISATWTGSLAPGASTTYAFTPTIDASAAGAYNIAAYTALVGDAENNNDTSYFTINTPVRYSTDYLADFESGLPADWSTDGTVGTGHNSGSGVLYRNMYSSVPTFTSTSSRIENIAAGDVFRFNYRYTNWSAGTVGTSLGTGDTLKVEISTDCGANWTLLDTIHAGNHTTSASVTRKEYDMSAYAGQVVVIRFDAKRGTGDYWLDLDNFYLGEGLSTTTSVVSNFNGRDISCHSASDGEAEVSTSGGVMPYTYAWDANAANQTNDTASALTDRKYYVTVTDALGYEIMDSITLNQPDTISVSVNATNPTCATNFDGALDLTITGGTLPYTISWSDGPASTEDRAAIDTGSYTVTITDANGCSYTDTYTLIIEDVVNPTVVTQNITVYLDGSGNASIVGADVDNGSSDNCGIASLSVSPSNFNCSSEGANTVTLTVTDVNGNQNSGTATVTVVDTISPVAVCQNLTVYLDGAGNASITASDLNNGSSDNCTVASLSLSQSSFSCADEGANNVTLTVTDQAGNQNTCVSVVTVVDSTAPTAVCQNLTVYLDASGSASITTGDLDNGSSDNCSIASMSLSQSSFSCADEGVNSVTLTVTDQAGNSNTCTANVTVVDTISPTTIAQNITVYLDGSGNATISAGDVDAGSSDNCSIASQSVSPSVFSCADEGANTVTLTNIDQAGNTSSTTATVTVMDTVSPTVVCQNLTIYLDGSGSATITANDVDNGSTDNCSITSIDVDKASFSCADEGANNVTLTVTDQTGNQSTCTAVVTVVDTISPTAVCQNLTVYLDGTGAASITPNDVDNGSSDNCSVASLSLDKSSFTCSDLGANTVSLTVTDQAGNQSTCSATVTVMDTISPSLALQNLTIYLDGNGQASITANDPDNGSTDNCSITGRTVSQTDYNCDDLGANTILFTATDQSGNQTSANVTVTVVDTISPTISTKSHTAYLDASGNASIQVIDVSSGTSNACSIDTVFLDIYDFTCADVGTNSVTVTAQATGGSASNSAIATVTVVDTISPVVNTQSLIMYLDANGQTSINTGMINNGSTDACGIASYALDITSFDCSNLGNNTVVLTVTDVNGNSATNTAIVEVRDTITPVAKSRDRTVYLNASGTVTVPASTINNGSTDNCSITPTLSQSVFTCADEGLNQEYLIITDADGNVDSADFLITVLDTISPSVITRNITVQLGATGLASISPNQLDSASSDNCSNQLFYTATKTSFSCTDLGVNTVTLTATDVHGNTTSRNATVTVEDNIAPIVQTQPVILSLDASGQASLTASMVNNGSSDNCAIDSLWISKETFDCSNLGTNSVTLFARDASGNQNSSAVIVTVQDQMDPVAVGTNATVYLDASGSASLSASMVDGGSTDNCAVSTSSVSVSSFNCSNVGANSVILSVEDASGNKSSTTVTVTVMDTISPTATAKNAVVSLDASGAASIVASDINDGSSDACGIASLTVSPSSFGCSDIGANTVTLTVTDNNGNVSTTTATVTVQDNRAPSALAQNTTIMLDASGNASLTASQVDNGSSDNCGISTYSISKSSFTCADLGNNTVILTVTDGSGNTSNATAVVTVVDNIAPTVSTQNLSVYLNANGSASISAGMVDNASSDNCSVASLSLDISSFDCTNIGANTVTLTATDGSGNSAAATATVTVIDTISPSVSTQNFTVNLDANGQGSITTSDIDDGSTDACGIASMSLDKTSFSCADIGSNTVSLTVTDNNGNAQSGTATVTVVDNISPTAAAQNITVYLGTNGIVSIATADVDNNSSDNCSIASMGLSNTTFDCGDVGNNTVVLTVTDGSGNSSNTTSVVTVVDTVSPNLSTQNINAYLDANGVVAVSATSLNNGSTDNCSIASYALSKSSFTCSDIGANTVTVTATDVNGNSTSAPATITVIDTISPTAVAQNITINLDANGNASIVASNISAGSSDACGIASMSVSPSSFTCTDLGANTVTLTVTDVNGNSSTASSTVTVVDAIAPTVVTQAHTVYLDASGQATISTTDINNGSTDNCSISAYSLNVTSFDCSNTGQNLVTLTATDGSGNSASSGAIVTVIDTISPSVSNTPANITAYATAGQCGTTVTWPTITGSDNCSVSNITASIPSGSFFNKGVTTVSLTAFDPSGNSGSSSFTVTVLDTIAPVFTSGVSGITVTPNANSCDAVATWTAPTATDNCSGVTYTASQASGSTFPLGTTAVTITATDADGNSRAISFNVTVTDVVAPTISNVPSNITVGNDAGSCDAAVTYTMPSVSDNCSGATISSSHPSGTVFPLGTTLVTFTATDAAGNSTNATFEVTVEDQEAPVFTSVPPSDTVGQCGQIYSFAMPTGSDNCSGLLLVRQTGGLPSGSVFPPGATTNTFEISDPAGNSTTTSFTIVVVPQGQPQLPSLIEACVNDAAVNITLGQNIVWSGNGVVNGGTTFDPAAAGTGRHLLTYVFTDSMGCNATGNIAITVLPKPVTPIITKVGSTTLQTGNYNSYQWYRDGVAIAGANLQSYTYTQSGNYQVEVSNTVGCFTYSAGFVVGSSGGGIGLQDLDLRQLEVYPNPNSGKFNIELNVEAIEDIQISLYSLDGRKIYEQKLQTDHDGKVQVDVGHLPTANYFLYIRTADQVAVRKMLMK